MHYCCSHKKATTYQRKILMRKREDRLPQTMHMHQQFAIRL
jgi:hypothetical protein